MNKPWSKKHKSVFKGCPHSLSNSFAQPLSQADLLERTKIRGGDDALIQEYHSHSLEYTPNGGSHDLRQDIAALYGPNIQAANVLVLAGGQVALHIASLCFARDCHSIVFTPGYQSTIESPMWASGSSVTQIPRIAHENWQINLDLVKQAIRSDTKYIVLNEPHNPSGIVMSPQLQKELLDIAREHDIVVLCDEVYRLLEHDTEDRIPAMADAYDRGISVVTMSKPWGACGVTIGWMACQNASMVEQLTDVQYFGTACVSRASEVQAMMVLRDSTFLLKERLRILKHNKGLLVQFMSDYSEWFEWKCPNAGAIAFVKFRGPLTSTELGDQLAAYGISIKPAYCFTDQSDVIPHEIDYFRVGFGESKMPIALKKLIEFVEAHKDEWD